MTTPGCSVRNHPTDIPCRSSPRQIRFVHHDSRYIQHMCHRGRFERAFSVAPGMETHPEFFLNIKSFDCQKIINKFLDHILNAFFIYIFLQFLLPPDLVFRNDTR